MDYRNQGKRRLHPSKLTAISLVLMTATSLSLYSASNAKAAEQISANHEKTFLFDIKAGPLVASLKEIAHITGATVNFNKTDLADTRAPAIQGNFATLQALQNAVGYSGLQVTIEANGQFKVYKPTGMEKVTVYGDRNDAETSFQVTDSETASRFASDLQSLPQSITVISAKVLESQQSQTVESVLQSVGGVATREGAQGSPTFQIRGFSQSGTLYNGVTSASSTSSNINGVERIEVLKGPQSILSGSSSLGGSVNIVPKKPTAEPIHDISVTYASQDDKGAAIDLSQGLSDDGKFSGRFIGAISRASSSDAGFEKGRESNYAQLGLRWNDDATDLFVNATYDKSFNPQSRYTFGTDGVLKAPSMRLGSKDAGVGQETKTVAYSLEHEFNDMFSVVSRAQYSDATSDLNVFSPQYLAASPTTFAMINSNSVTKTKTLSGDHFARIQLDLGPVSNQIATGINHTYTKTHIDSYNGDAEFVDVYADEQYDFTSIARTEDNLYSLSNYKTQQIGLYAQDLITIHDFHISAGLRHDFYKNGPQTLNYITYNFISATEQKETEKTTANMGLVYEISENLSVYGSYSEGFLPQFTSTPLCDNGGISKPPMETTNKELGAKLLTNDGHFSLTGSVYDVQQKNVLSYSSAGQCYNVREAQKTQGAELEAQGRPIDGLNLLFSYTYTDIEDVGDPDTRPGAQPRHQGSLWSNYDFQDETVYGLGVGLGVTAYSSSLMGYTSSATSLPGGARVDASLYYESLGWSVRFNVNNLFDRTLYGYASSILFVPILPERNYSMTFKYSF